MGHSVAVWDHKAAIELTKDGNGIEQVVLRNPHGASARINLHGGQVISWQNDRGEEQLFTGRKFGNSCSLEQNGFAKNKIWTVEHNPLPFHPNDSHGKSFIDLLLKPAEEDLKYWPHGLEFRLRVSLALDGNLTLTSRIRNINGKPFSFAFAYHTYLSVSDIRIVIHSEVRIEGLETLDYLDNLSQRRRFTEQGDAITFESEVYLHVYDVS
ncbi:Galactose mutarotase-like superfamily protein [Abeliophyllum distichum]|uniref:Galactose mutarotase-like superfamily protein n=1 Tax=Abeliophyllum distichum TaxID=126358 RepID=A0ABD1RRC2_9LAMI